MSDPSLSDDANRSLNDECRDLMRMIDNLLVTDFSLGFLMASGIAISIAVAMTVDEVGLFLWLCLSIGVAMIVVSVRAIANSRRYLNDIVSIMMETAHFRVRADNSDVFEDECTQRLPDP